MHEGINRQDGRHWCAPDTAPEGEVLVLCKCGKTWALEKNTWYELVDTDELPAFPPAGEVD